MTTRFVSYIHSSYPAFCGVSTFPNGFGMVMTACG